MVEVVRGKDGRVFAAIRVVVGATAVDVVVVEVVVVLVVRVVLFMMDVVVVVLIEDSECLW